MRKRRKSGQSSGMSSSPDNDSYLDPSIRSVQLNSDHEYKVYRNIVATGEEIKKLKVDKPPMYKQRVGDCGLI